MNPAIYENDQELETPCRCHIVLKFDSAESANRYSSHSQETNFDAFRYAEQISPNGRPDEILIQVYLSPYRIIKALPGHIKAFIDEQAPQIGTPQMYVCDDFPDAKLFKGIDLMAENRH